MGPRFARAHRILSEYHRKPDQQLQDQVVAEDKERVVDNCLSHKETDLKFASRPALKGRKLYQSQLIHIGNVP